MAPMICEQRALAAAPKLTVDHAVALWLYTCESPLYRTLYRLLCARNRGRHDGSLCAAKRPPVELSSVDPSRSSRHQQ
jgi:hypothetical protein